MNRQTSKSLLDEDRKLETNREIVERGESRAGQLRVSVDTPQARARTQRRNRLSKTVLIEAAKIAREYGVSVRIDPDGSISISPLVADRDTPPPADDGLEKW